MGICEMSATFPLMRLTTSLPPWWETHGHVMAGGRDRIRVPGQLVSRGRRRSNSVATSLSPAGADGARSSPRAISAALGAPRTGGPGLPSLAYFPRPGSARP